MADKTPKPEHPWRRPYAAREKRRGKHSIETVVDRIVNAPGESEIDYETRLARGFRMLDDDTR